MESTKRTAKKNGNRSNQQLIVRFRASTGLHERLKKLAEEEELCLSAFVRRLVLDSLTKFPG
jgi:hypothetical protein